VKCDEQKPECQRCLRASRNCEGYTDLGRGVASQQLPLEPGSITTYSIPFKVPGSQADRQLLHYYCSQAAWNLSYCADPALWTKLILQRASHQPVIRNALVALSSLHKDYLCGELAAGDCLQSDADANSRPTGNVKTMGMISRCHRQLRTYLSRPDASPDVALICSVIFYTFESLLGESQRAIWHLDQGLILLRKCQYDKSLDQNDPLIPRLAVLLQHLDVQASCFDDRRPPVLNLASDAEAKGQVNVVPESFVDLAHAEIVLIKLQNWTLHHLVNYVHYRGATPEDLPSESFVERLLLASQLDKYDAALTQFASFDTPSSFDTPFSGVTPSSTSLPSGRKEDERQQREQRLLRLRIQLHTFSYLIKETIPLLSPDTYEIARKVTEMIPGYSSKACPTVMTPIGNADADLEAALVAIEALVTSNDTLTDPSGMGPTRSTRLYTLSTHLIAALYFLSLKTTNKQTLARATALFSHPDLRETRDGLWDSQKAASLVESLVKVRQKGNVTIGQDGTDIIMHISDQDQQVEVDELQRVFSISEKQGLPMMQSKKFTLVSMSGTLIPDEQRHDMYPAHTALSKNFAARLPEDDEDEHMHDDVFTFNYAPLPSKATPPQAFRFPVSMEPPSGPFSTLDDDVIDPDLTSDSPPTAPALSHRPSPSLTSYSDLSQITPNHIPSSQCYFSIDRPSDHGRATTLPSLINPEPLHFEPSDQDFPRSQSATPYSEIHPQPPRPASWHRQNQYHRLPSPTHAYPHPHSPGYPYHHHSNPESPSPLLKTGVRSAYRAVSDGTPLSTLIPSLPDFRAVHGQHAYLNVPYLDTASAGYHSRPRLNLYQDRRESWEREMETMQARGFVGAG
jgi:hypothetical protein